MADAERGVAASSTSISRTLDKQKKAFAGLGASITQLAGAVGLFAAAHRGLEVLRVAGEINDLSRAANMGSEEFQAFAAAARRAGIDGDTLATSTRKFAINVAELRANYGGFNEFLKEHAPAVRADLLATEDQGDAYRVLADAFRSLASEGDRTALAVKAFGKSGADMVEIMQDGRVGIEEFTERARELGQTLSPEITNAIEQVNDNFREFRSVTENAFVKAVSGAYSFWKSLSALKQPTEDLIAANLALQKAGKISWTTPPAFMTPEQIAEGRRLMGASSPSEVAPNYFGVGDHVPQGVRMPGRYDDRLSRSPERDFAGADALAGLRAQHANALGNIGDASRMQYDKEVESFRRMLNEKKISEDEFKNARKLAGDIMLQQVKENMGAESEEMRRYFEGVRTLIEGSFMSAFSEAIETGKFKAQDFFKSLTKGFAELTMQALILKPIMDNLFQGGGGIGSLFGGLFTPARAAGGPGVGGQAYMTGEHGRELFVPNASGRFFNARDTAGMMGGATTNNYIDARGADISVAQRIERALAVSERSRTDPVRAVSQAQRRFPNRAA